MASSPESYNVTYPWTCSERMRASAGQCCEVADVVAYSQPFSVQQSKFGRCSRLVDRYVRVGCSFFFSPSSPFLISPIAIGFRLGIALRLPGDQPQHQRVLELSEREKKKKKVSKQYAVSFPFGVPRPTRDRACWKDLRNHPSLVSFVVTIFINDLIRFLPRYAGA